MKKLIFALLVLVATGASAQNGITNEFRFGQGEDSIRCLEAISISSINVKNKDFNTAYNAWKIVFTEFPVARVDTYINGIKILKMTDEDFAAADKAALIDALPGNKSLKELAMEAKDMVVGEKNEEATEEAAE